jgi:hypothetical protein
MRKLSLEIEALTVESFETDEDAREGGTVRARSVDNDPHGLSLDTCQTCDRSQCVSCYDMTCTCHALCEGAA